MKQALLNNLKNIWGWKTNRKVVVISVDDYGNVRLASKAARNSLDKAGLKTYTRFDAYDTLETREDLEVLYDTLSSVRDKKGNHAVFTPFALPCNINFEEIINQGYAQYVYESLPETYQKLESIDSTAYAGTWNLWIEGIKKGLMVPQFHGREHLNLKVFEEKLHAKDKELITCLKNRSYTSLSQSGYDTISYTAAFDFWDFDENDRFTEIIKDGLNQFKTVYGYASNHFNPPGGREHPIIHKTLKENGVEYIDTPFLKQEHQGNGKYKKTINHTGKKTPLGMTYQVRNVVFEPTNNNGTDWVAYTLKQIETAFLWKRPAIISSHRVNFCGHINQKNRAIGIDSLQKLLRKIVKKWPDVEFMSANTLGDIITKKYD